MNIQADLRKVYNIIKKNQIPDDKMTNENASRAIYMAGMLHASQLFMNLYNGDMNEKTLEFELNELNQETLN
jgi:hypothetical protein